MKEVEMMMTFEDTPEEFKLTGEFSDEDLMLLEAYRKHANDLRETKVIRNGYFKKIELKITPGEGIAIQSEGVDDEFISSFLHKLRPLILHDEPASFDRTAGLIKRRFAHKAMKKHLKGVRSRYQTSRFDAYGQLTIANVPVFNEETVKTWLNAFEYHQDKEKREALRHVENEFSDNGARLIFAMQLHDRCAGIFLLDQLCRFILDFDGRRGAEMVRPDETK